MRGDNQEMITGELPSLVALGHELKAPLSLIRQLSVARGYYDEAQYEIALRRIELTAEKSLRLVEALTRTYRTSELESEPIHVVRLCEEIAHELVPFCKENGQSMQLELPTKPLLLVGNRELVSSVIFGLCDNALYYGNTKNPVTLKAAYSGENVRVSVRDDGPSIKKQDLQILRAKLGHAPQALSNRPGSSGLGLYIAGQFAEAMNGKLGMTRHRKKGQSFFLDLPRSSQLSLLGV